MTLTTEEIKWIDEYARLEQLDLGNHWQTYSFQRLQFRSEIHVRNYSGVRTTASCNVACSFVDRNEVKLYYGTVEKLLMIKGNDFTLRLAIVTTYKSPGTSKAGIPFIDLKSPYKTGKVIEVTSIDHKVIFTKDAKPFVLRVANKLGR